MHSNQYFLQSVKSNMNENLIALAEYTTLKAALIKAYSLPLHKKLTQLCTAPPLRDRSPTQLRII